ncbi:hypothetical protein CAPTEDRAFT_205160 [Capitella teleta]|uniref:Uncharacterized protein n=1 Tax=Capitella teleta TaxID=283909 RepID=R7TSH6_CAPTE|nr:hypothetical protein CAPTEDRAFT_205160 [Capitella teleta]|eukprot:ELT96828.1 hypothetical protein CAPTEDRAFT_205160 [Capitella teleta]
MKVNKCILACPYEQPNNYYPNNLIDNPGCMIQQESICVTIGQIRSLGLIGRENDRSSEIHYTEQSGNMLKGLIRGEGAMFMKVVGGEEFAIAKVLDGAFEAGFGVDPFVVAFLSMYVFSAGLMLLTSSCWQKLGLIPPLLKEWFTETGEAVRSNIQKSVVFNACFNTAVLLLYLVLPSDPFDPADDDLSNCVCPVHHLWMLAVLCLLVFCFASLRYMAHMLRHTKNYHGYVVYSPPPAHQMASIFTANFGRVIALSLVIFVFPVALGGLRLRSQTAELSVMHKFVLCSPKSDPDSPSWQITAQSVVITTVLVALPMIIVLVIEHAIFCSYRNIKAKIPGFYVIINSPFVTTQLVTTWPGWLAAIALTAQIHGNLPRLYCAVWALLAPMDCLAMLCIFTIASCLSKK